MVSANSKPYLVAEIGLNHNKDMKLAADLIAAAAEAGADAVKFQSYTTELFVNSAVEKAKILVDIFSEYELTVDEHQQLKALADKNKIDFFSTPLTLDWPARLAELKVDFFKVASGDLNNYALLLELLKYEVPLIVSTGASAAEDIKASINFIQERGRTDCIYLHCVSLYPTAPEKAKLATIGWLAEQTGGLTGFSDHTDGVEAALAAAALGARVIEKHFTLDHDLPGPDHKISATPEQLQEIRRLADLGFAMRGEARKEPWPEEAAGDFFGKRSLYEIDGQLVPMRPRQPHLPKDSDFLNLS